MALITTVSRENAEGLVKEAYEMFMKNIGTIPRPMELLSVSPALFEIQLQRIKYFGKHPTLSFALLTHIRYLAAKSLDYGFCMDLNRLMLKKQGLGDEDIRNVETDPSKSLLDEKESAMLVFVMKAMKNPGSVTADDIQTLKNLGWNDSDMVDALSQGVSMIDHAIMMQAFQMDQHCMIA